MKNKLQFLLFKLITWVILLAACTTTPAPTILPSSTAKTHAIATNTQTPTPEPSATTTTTSTPTQTPTSTPTITSTPEPQIISPLISSICKEPGASPAEIGIKNQIFLVETFDDLGNKITSRGAMIADPDSLRPEPIPSTTANSGMKLWASTVIPDGKWVDITYLSSKLHRTEEKLISWDGNQIRQVYAEAYDPLDFYFLYEENKLVILDTIDPNNLNYLPIAVRDLASGGERSLPGVPKEAYWAKVFFTTPGGVYNLLVWQGGPHEGRLYLYNDADRVTVPAFRWMNEPAGWLVATPYRDAQGKFGLYALRSYGLDLAFNLDLETVLSDQPYGDMMKKIRLPFSEVAGYPEMAIARLNNALLLAAPAADGVNQFAVYRLNYPDLSLDDFCISNAAGYAQIAVSADGKFAAVNFFLLDPPGIHLKGVVLLNLETGQRFWIPGAPFAVIGWQDK